MSLTSTSVTCPPCWATRVHELVDGLSNPVGQGPFQRPRSDRSQVGILDLEPALGQGLDPVDASTFEELRALGLHHDLEAVTVEHQVFCAFFTGLDHRDLVARIERAWARDLDSDREVSVLVRLQELADRVAREGREFDGRLRGVFHCKGAGSGLVDGWARPNLAE